MIAALVFASECWLNPVLGMSMLEVRRDLQASEEGKFKGVAPLDVVEVVGDPNYLVHLSPSNYVELKGANMFNGLGLDGSECKFEAFQRRTGSATWLEGWMPVTTPGLKEGWKPFLGLLSATLVGPPLAQDFRTGATVPEEKLAPRIGSLFTISWNGAVKELGKACYAEGGARGRLEAVWQSGGAFQDVAVTFNFGAAKGKIAEAKGEAGLTDSVAISYLPGKAKTWREALRLAKLSDEGARVEVIDGATTEIRGLPGLPPRWSAHVYGKNEIESLRLTKN